MEPLPQLTNKPGLDWPKTKQADGKPIEEQPLGLFIQKLLIDALKDIDHA